MRRWISGLAMLLLAPGVVAAPPPPPPLGAQPQAIPEGAGRPDTPSTQPTADRNLYQRPGAAVAMRTSDPQAYTRQLFSRFPERIVDVEERFSGPGAFLFGVTLYERPEAHHMAGLCQVRVHEVFVNTAPPPQNPPRHAEAVRTSTRYLAIGPVNSTIPPAGQRERCASLQSARNFFSASESDVLPAMQTLTDARYFVTNMPRAISFTCESFRNQCSDPAQIFMRYLTPDRVRSVERIACTDGSTDVDTPCFRISFASQGLEIGGDWSVTTQGPRRPVHIHLEQSHPPVS